MLTVGVGYAEAAMTAASQAKIHGIAGIAGAIKGLLASAAMSWNGRLSAGMSSCAAVKCS